ncbi:MULTISPECIES: SprT family zinc-dependent metalloprotease [unclassified Sulfurimonas]|uniref:M48 family metallopeptidase n=1 Tax=unclassified Sulfurimonas TaxID=2623549 RepID=UPI000B0FFAFD|nr:MULTISPECIES: SprT family zinc-dependent metalloprotease [unclassified Sulfurimonas]
MSISEINFNNLRILHIYKPNLKNSYISVKKNGEITLKTSVISNSYIQNLLIKKEFWIRKQLKIVEQNRSMTVNIQDEVILFGEIYSIDTNEANALREYLKNVDVSNIINISKCYDKFYKESAQSYIVPRVEHYAKIMNLNYSDIKFRKMRSRWGSCSSRGIITFNTELVKIGKNLIDFIVVHELAHITHMNHSKKFHLLVERYIPDAKVLNQELRRFSLS